MWITPWGKSARSQTRRETCRDRGKRESRSVTVRRDSESKVIGGVVDLEVQSEQAVEQPLTGWTVEDVTCKWFSAERIPTFSPPGMSFSRLCGLFTYIPSPDAVAERKDRYAFRNLQQDLVLYLNSCNMYFFLTKTWSNQNVIQPKGVTRP